MAISGPNIDIEQDNTSGGATVTTGKILYFKDVKPTYQSSDTSDSTNKERLKTLLLSWGFSDVNVTGVTMWKIATQYTTAGPRLEWKGSLSVSCSGLHALKCKNKDKTSYQLCTDIQSNNTVLLDTNASTYSDADWKWIHVSELGFGMNKNIAFQWQNNAWNYNKLLTPNEWVSMNVNKINSNIAEIDNDFTGLEDVTLPTKYYNDDLIKWSLVSEEVGSFATIPRYYINNNGTLEAFKGFSFKSQREETMNDGYFGVNNLIINNKKNSKMKYHSMQGGYIPMLLSTNSNMLNSTLDDGYWTLYLNEHYVLVDFWKDGKHERNNWGWNPDTDFVIIYVRKKGTFSLTQGVPLALNYWDGVKLNESMIGFPGYLTLSNQGYDGGPIGCFLYDKQGGILTKGDLNFNIIDDSNINQNYSCPMLLFQPVLINNTNINYSWNSMAVFSNNSAAEYGWDTKNASSMFPNKITKNLDLIKSIIKTKNEEVTLPIIKNIADYETQSALFNKNKHFMKLGTADSSKEGGVWRLQNGIKTTLSIKNFPYIDLPINNYSMSSDYGTGTDLKVAGDCYGYTKSNRDATGSIKEFEMICKGTLRDTYPGTYPETIDLINIPEMKGYDGKWTCSLDFIHGGNTLDGINSGWTNRGIGWDHESGNWVRESISWHLSVGYENPDCKNNRKYKYAFYVVLWKKIEMD